MKRKYNTPSVNVTFVHTLHMLAVSLGKNATGADDDVVLVKTESNNHSSYSVWDDDWSE